MNPMKFKPGDIIVYIFDSDLVYLVLEVDDKEEVYKVFVLRDLKKERVGKKHRLCISHEQHWYTNLKNMDLAWTE